MGLELDKISDELLLFLSSGARMDNFMLGDSLVYRRGIKLAQFVVNVKITL